MNLTIWYVWATVFVSAFSLGVLGLYLQSLTFYRQWRRSHPRMAHYLEILWFVIAFIVVLTLPAAFVTLVLSFLLG